MRPILFKLGNINIYGYGTMMAIGICAGLFLLMNRGKKAGYNEDNILDMAIVAVIFGILGGKLVYIITDIKNIMNNPSVLKAIGNGFVVYGAIILGILGVYLYCRKKGWKTLKIFDLTVPSLALGQGFGRIGCFLAGCCYGRETDLSIGVKFKEDSLGPHDIFVHPTQIYSSIFDFSLALFLLWYSKKERKDGRVFSLYLIIYAIGRFSVEFLRNDPRGNVGILSTSQFISIFTLGVGIIFYNLDRIRKSAR